MRKIHVQDLGCMEFGATWKVQEDLFNKAIDLKIAARKGETTDLPDNHFLYVEHPHVFTLGKSGDEENLLLNEEELSKEGATYFKINRGGDITYHGP